MPCGIEARVQPETSLVIACLAEATHRHLESTQRK